MIGYIERMKIAVDIIPILYIALFTHWAFFFRALLVVRVLMGWNLCEGLLYC